jgi:hypothetical protein
MVFHCLTEKKELPLAILRNKDHSKCGGQCWFAQNSDKSITVPHVVCAPGSETPLCPLDRVLLIGATKSSASYFE